MRISRPLSLLLIVLFAAGVMLSEPSAAPVRPFTLRAHADGMGESHPSVRDGVEVPEGDPAYLRLPISAADGTTGPFRIPLQPAPGVTLPSGSFTCGGIRFNTAGEVVEILEVAGASCRLNVIFDPDTGEFYLDCDGDCTPPVLECALYFDLLTLTYRCSCL